MSELLRAAMVDCAERVSAGRSPGPFHGCAHGMGGGPATGVMQLPLAVTAAADEPARTLSVAQDLNRAHLDGKGETARAQHHPAGPRGEC